MRVALLAALVTALGMAVNGCGGAAPADSDTAGSKQTPSRAWAENADALCQEAVTSTARSLSGDRQPDEALEIAGHIWLDGFARMGVHFPSGAAGEAAKGFVQKGALFATALQAQASVDVSLPGWEESLRARYQRIQDEAAGLEHLARDLGADRCAEAFRAGPDFALADRG